MTVPEVLTALAAGLFAAGHAASWGAYKDSPFEGFRWRSYLRTFALGAVTALLLVLWLPVGSAGAAVVLVGATYALERLATEWWKSIVRDDDQAAYTIPMRLGVLGRPVQSPRVRFAAGAGVVLLIGGGVSGVHVAQAALHPAAGLPEYAAALVVGGLGGWATAVGGAWKDAPVEGFSFAKFLRSPVVATAWALPVALLTTSWPAIMLSAAGFAVVSIETYKTFFTRGRPPGKFAGKQVLSALPRLRSALAVQNGLWWGVFGALVVVAAPSLALPAAALASGLVVAVVRRGIEDARPAALGVR